LKQLNTLDVPWRPALEFRAVLGWGVALAGIFYTVHTYNDMSRNTMMPAYVVGFCCLVILMLRLKKGISVLSTRRRLMSGKLEFITFDKMIKKIRALEKKENGALWIGKGFLWSRDVVERAYDLTTRGEEEILGKKANDNGALWMHGIGPKEQDVFQATAYRGGHTLVVGTTGAGKTRMFDLMIAQDIMRGEAVIIIDPKGDKELCNNAKKICEMMGQPERFAYFNPAFPEKSVSFDPLKNWNRSTELASRISSLIPSETGADPFQAFGWMALNDVIQGMLAIEEQPNLRLIRKYVEGGIDELLVLALRKHFIDSVNNWESRVSPYLTRFKGDEAKAYLEFIKKDAKDEEKATHLEGLIRTFEHNKEHYQKMIASLMPILSMLTSSPLDELLSPVESESRDRIISSSSIIQGGMVLYMGLDSLSDATVGSAIGSIMLSDLTAVAGDRYNYGLDNKPVNIYVDEAAEVMNKPAIQLLNKGRGAGFRMIVATQTIADFIARLGDEAMARQVLGNLNNRFILRIMDGDTQKYLAEGLQPVKVGSLETQLRSGVASNSLDNVNSMVGETLKYEDADLIPPALFGKIPNLHYFAQLVNGQVYKLRIPILVNNDH